MGGLLVFEATWWTECVPCLEIRFTHDIRSWLDRTWLELCTLWNSFMCNLRETLSRPLFRVIAKACILLRSWMVSIIRQFVIILDPIGTSCCSVPEHNCY